MHDVSWSRRRSSCWICSSIRGRHARDSFAQSAFVGVRPSGSVASAFWISSSVRPIVCAARMNAIRRSTSRA